MQSLFKGSSAALGVSNGSKTTALFKRAEKSVKKATPSTQTIKRAPQKAQRAIKKAVRSPPVPSRKPASGRGGGKAEEGLWLPNTTRPQWLDGSLPGDRGFDPLGLAKPAEYLQVDIDELDQNKAVNKAGGIVGQFKASGNGAVSTDSLQPYDEVFGLDRFRETELIHGRWAMLATLGVVVAEATTGVAWQDAGKVELDGASYLGLGLPFTVTQLTIIEVLLVGGAEIYRNTERDLTKRQYPGGVFDPLNLASSGSEERTFNLKTAELKHGRLAMIAFLGFGVQALTQGEGALGSLAKFSGSFERAVEAVEGVTN